MRYVFDCPLRWSDLDAYGHVNNARFLTLYEEARVALMFNYARAQGLTSFEAGVVVSRHGEVIDTGAGAAALGNPARCVAWLANKLGSLGDGLKAGDIVLPGAVHKMVSVASGDVFRADFAHLGPVTVRFTKRSDRG